MRSDQAMRPRSLKVESPTAPHGVVRLSHRDGCRCSFHCLSRLKTPREYMTAMAKMMTPAITEIAEPRPYWYWVKASE